MVASLLNIVWGNYRFAEKKWYPGMSNFNALLYVNYIWKLLNFNLSVIFSISCLLKTYMFLN